MKSVRLFLDYIEDRRFSMEGYAAELASRLPWIGEGRFSVEAFRPTYRRTPFVSTGWSDRIARYVGYVMQIPRNPADVNHIVDHGYAHLMMRLPPERTIVTVHDLIPLLAHRGMIPRERRHRPWLSEFSARYLDRAAALVAVSERTKADLISLLGVHESRVHTIPNGLAPEYRVLTEDRVSIRRRLGLPDEPLLLITGTQFYKNHATSVAVLDVVSRGMSGNKPRIVCLGRLSPDARARAAALGVSSQIMEIQAQDRARVIELYNAVDCLLFPSVYEGFGWPPLEAMACGVPVVCSRSGALVEVVGDCALIADAFDVESLAQAVLRVLSDDLVRQGLRKSGLERAKLYDWDSRVASLAAVYDSIPV